MELERRIENMERAEETCVVEDKEAEMFFASLKDDDLLIY